MFIFEKPETFTCVFRVTVGDRVKSFTLATERITLEEQFMLLVNDAARSNVPVKVEMLRKVPIYDEFDKCWIERENSLVFTNKAWNDWKEA